MPDYKDWLLSLLLVLPILGFAQNVREIHLDPDVRISLVPDPVTAVAIRADSFLGNEVILLINNERILVPYDPDAPDFTWFTSLETPMDASALEVDSEIPVTVFLINSGPTPPVDPDKYRNQQQECEFEFQAIPQSEWRSGLPAPSYNRSFTEVSHVVIHHSAGSNTNTNYTQVVRDIYLYHTEVNDWSDIGYNYLVAQNGNIYTGRDPASGQQDNVLGAHFCGANSTTMGICLLGNYEEAQPTGISLNALRQLIAFKVNKENLDPFGSYPHAFGQLGSIIGHRDGCSTLCPGENVYNLLSAIRTDTESLLEDCTSIPPQKKLDFTFTEFSINSGEEVTFENQSAGYTSYQWLYEGGSPRFSNFGQGNQVTYSLPGTYDVMLIGFTESTSDTLRRPDIIEVVGPPVIYPNPVAASGSLQLASTSDVVSLHLITLNGQVKELKTNTGKVAFPQLEPGVYLLRIQTSNQIFIRKLSVN